MSLYELFQHGAKQYCSRPAICFYNGITSTFCSYRNLTIESQKIFDALNERGIKSHVIAVVMPMGINVITALIGVLGARNCFYYLDPLDLKLSKKFEVLQNKIKFSYCLTDSEEAVHELETRHGSKNTHKIADQQLFIVDLNEEPKKLKGDIAYVVTTSGSTGSPKIVHVPNKSIVPNILDIVESFQQSSEDIVFMSSPLTFDPSYVQMFTTFYTGSCLLIVDDYTKMDSKKLLTCISTLHQVTILQTTPSLLHLCGDGVEKVLLSKMSPLKILALGGEKCPSMGTLRRWKNEGNKTRIFNIYGITEVSCWATMHEISPSEFKNLNGEVCLGKPLDKTMLEIRNFDKETSEGELWIGSDERVCILDEEEEDPAANPIVVMRPSGDIVKSDENGMLYYVGRTDGLIKRMGKRMHLQEVDEIMMNLEDVVHSATLWNEERLLLFVVIKSTEATESIREDDVFSNRARQHIKSLLPPHYLPSKVLLVNQMPVNSHGKVNKSELLKLYSNMRISCNLVVNDIKQEFLKLASELLGISFQNSHLLKSWAQLGGNSIMAVSILSELQEKFPSVSNLFLHKILSDSSLEDTADYLNQEKFQRNIHSEKKRKQPDDAPHEYLKESKLTKHDASSNTSVISRSGVYILVNHEENFKYIKIKTVTTKNTQVSHGLQLRECWKFDTEKCVDASPLIVFGKEGDVYIGSHSFTFASLGLHSGACNWKVKLNDRIESSACLSNCTQFIITACYSGNIYVLERSTGNVHWVFATQNSIKSSPVTHPQTGIVYVGSHDSCLYAMDIQNKMCKWRKNLNSGALFSSPCISSDGKNVFIGTLGGMLFCVDANDGFILWYLDLNEPIFSSPVMTTTHCLVGCVDGCLHAINIQTKQKDWKFATGGPIFSSPKVFSMGNTALPPKEMVVIGSHDKHAYCINTTSGSLVWKSRLDSEIYGIPCLLPSGLNGATTDSNELQEVHAIIVCSTKGTIYMLNICDGSELTNFKVGSEIFSSPCAIDNKVLLGCRDNCVYCLEIK